MIKVIMKSKTKYFLNKEQINKIFDKANLGQLDSYYNLGAGEFNSVYSVRIGAVDYVLKIAPRDGQSVLTYEKDMLDVEIKWYKRISENTDIKVPRIYFSDFSREIIDAPYFIMEKLNGVQLNKIESNSMNYKNDGPIAKLAQMAAQIHKVKNDKYGYEQNSLQDNWYLALRTMTENLINDAKSKGRKCRRGKRLLGFIDKFKSILEDAPCCMVNFDLWAPNVICEKMLDGSYNYAWIDPERTFWGDYVADFVALEFGKNFEDKKISIESYNAVADTPLVVTEQLKVRYYVAEAYIALIQEVEKYYRYTIFNFGWYRNVVSAKLIFKRAFMFLQSVQL
ncbi:MAG: aminoglycoside phosphotransferase family protein [Clostridia bacterium]|nr:aminoglycoside phosphotransferase family protein [Clostridia bacterium]